MIVTNLYITYLWSCLTCLAITLFDRSCMLTNLVTFATHFQSIDESIHVTSDSEVQPYKHFIYFHFLFSKETNNYK